MAIITFLRHCPLPLKYQKRYIGHSDIKIDRNLIDMKKLEALKDKNFDLIFSSTLLRCKETLALLNFKYEEDERLKEVEFKKHIEGKNFQEIENLEIYDESYLSSEDSWHKFICRETKEEFELRLKSFIKELPKDKNILVCSHAGAIKKMLELLKYKGNTSLDYSVYAVVQL